MPGLVILDNRQLLATAAMLLCCQAAEMATPIVTRFGVIPRVWWRFGFWFWKNETKQTYTRIFTTKNLYEMLFKKLFNLKYNINITSRFSSSSSRAWYLLTTLAAAIAGMLMSATSPRAWGARLRPWLSISNQISTGAQTIWTSPFSTSVIADNLLR